MPLLNFQCSCRGPAQCSCRGPAQLLKFDSEIWEKTVKDCRYHQSPTDNGVDGSRPFIPGFIDLVTNRRLIEPRWLYRLRRGQDIEALDDNKDYGFCINLADVQRMHLRLLQGRLTWLALSAGFDRDHGASQGVLTELGPTLRDYTQAIRDHEYMGRYSGQRHDPFRVSSERFQDKWVLDKLLGRKLKTVRDFQWLKPMAAATGPWEDGEGPMRPIGGTRGEAFKHALWSRATGSLVGAAFLIGPMWALVLNQDVYLQLGVTTGCIVAFGSVMVVALDTLEAVFAATLAYAAVLMVFVGVVMQSLGGHS